MDSNQTTSPPTPAPTAPAPPVTGGAAERVVTGWTLLFGTLVLVGLALLAVALLPNLAAATYGETVTGEAAVAQETLRIADELQCPVCEGQSVAFSNSQLATEMRRQVEEQLRAGESEASIKQFFIDRYGVRVLREPPREGINLWLWRLPILGLLIGIVGLIWNLRHAANDSKAQHKHAQHTAIEPTDGDDPLDPEVRDLLTHYDKDLFQS